MHERNKIQLSDTIKQNLKEYKNINIVGDIINNLLKLNYLLPHFEAFNITYGVDILNRKIDGIKISELDNFKGFPS